MQRLLSQRNKIIFKGIGGGGSRVKIYFLLIFGLCCSPVISSFQNGLVCLSSRNDCGDVTRQSWDIRALFRENVWENRSKRRKFSHKWTKI